MKPKDQDIIKALLTGSNEKAIQALYESSFRKIKDFIKKNSGSTEDAEDVFQDVVIGFYRYVKENKFDNRFDIDAFLFTSARNAWINKVKKNQRITSLPEHYNSASDESLYGKMTANERHASIAMVFEKVGTKCRELLTMVVYYDYSMKELCEKMGFPNENAAKTQHYKCKQKLIELVGNNNGFKQLLKHAE